MSFLSKLFKKKTSFCATKGNYVNTMASTAPTWDVPMPANSNAFCKSVDDLINELKNNDYMSRTCKYSTYDIYGNKIGEMDVTETVDAQSITSGSVASLWTMVSNNVLAIDEARKMAGYVKLKWQGKMITRKKDEIEMPLKKLMLDLGRKLASEREYDIYGNEMNIIHQKKHNYLHHNAEYNLQRASKFGVGNLKGGHLI